MLILKVNTTNEKSSTRFIEPSTTDSDIAEKTLRQEIVKEKLNLKNFFHFITTADKVKTTIKKPINSATGKTYWIFVRSYY